MKENKSFQMTLSQSTLNFLEGWYELPIQEILRVLATVDKQTKQEAQQPWDVLSVVEDWNSSLKAKRSDAQTGVKHELSKM